MDTLLFVILIILLVSTPGIAASEKVVDVFRDIPIQYGEEIAGSTWQSEDKGRIVVRKIKLPEFENPVRITARLTFKSTGDNWDRFGSVFLVPSEGPAIELIKFMTGFGTGLKGVGSHSSVKKWADKAILEQDVSALSELLQGEVTIKAIIDTWVSPGWLLNFQLIYQPDKRSNNPDWVYPLINNTGEYWTNDKFTTDKATVEVKIPEGLESVKMYYYTSGHGGKINGDEFNKKDNVIYIDEREILRFTPWREDGRLFRAYNPTSAKWDGDIWSSDLCRSNWIPGDKVSPMIFELGDILDFGKHKIRFSVEDIQKKDLNYWNISAFLVGYKEKPQKKKELKPYLQTPTDHSIYVSWQDNSDFSSLVYYGTTKALRRVKQGNTQIIGDKIVWHSVKLTGLKPDTKYYYQIRSGNNSSKIYQFKTPPVNKKGHLHFGVLSSSIESLDALFQKNQGFLENYFVVSDCNI